MNYKILFFSAFIVIIITILWFLFYLTKNNPTHKINDFTKASTLNFFLNTKDEVVQTTYTVKGFIEGKIKISDVNNKDYYVAGKIDTTIFRDWYHNSMNMRVEPIEKSKGHLSITVYFGTNTFF